MSYRLINSNEIAIKYPEVNDMPCIYADIPNGLNGDFYDLSVYPKIVENFEQPTVCDIPPFINKLCVSSGVCREDKMKVLEQIRAEIDGIEINGQVDEHTMFIRSGEQVKQMALDIVDKYKGK